MVGTLGIEPSPSGLQPEVQPLHLIPMVPGEGVEPPMLPERDRIYSPVRDHRPRSPGKSLLTTHRHAFLGGSSNIIAYTYRLPPSRWPVPGVRYYSLS